VTEGAQNPVAAVVGTFSNTAAGLITDFRQFGKEISSTPEEATSTSAKSNGGSTAEDEKLCSPAQIKRRRSAVTNLAGSLLSHTLRAPVALFYNLANGFHNSPTVLLSDRTVRCYPPITDLGSGLALGGKEFVFGLYDAVMGLVYQPYLGYKEASERNTTPAVGIAKGMGRGIGGLVLKSSSAATGIIGYPFKGLEREIERWWLGSDVFLHAESEILFLAKDQVKNKIQQDSGGRSRVQMMWDDSKGAGMGKRILERRVWQGYREVMNLRVEEGGKALEIEVLERWDKLVKILGLHLE
jgi:hypothetical protein